MPLVAHNALPTFARLRQEGMTVLPADRALHQDIRELHVGLLNMMPDAAMAATERQFYRLVGEANPIAQFHMHPFTLPELKRSAKAQEHIDNYYDTFDRVQTEGLDALIITGANVTQPDLSQEPFWEPLRRVVDWARANVTSVLCSCLATHSVMQFLYAQKRRPLGFKRWGVFSHRVMEKHHPLVNDVNTEFDVPHSRFNEVTRDQFDAAGVSILAESEEAGVHLAVSEDGLRVVFLQGHPEYDTISLLKEYKREVIRFSNGDRNDYPPLPENYFDVTQQALISEYRLRLMTALERGEPTPEFPEALVAGALHNTWHDTAEAIVGNWIGAVYQVTNKDRKLPFMEGVDPNDPMGLRK